MRRIYIVVLILLPALTMGQNFRETIKAGNRQYDNQEFEKAASSYMKAQKIAPDDPRASFNLGNALYMQNQYDSATAEYLKVINEMESVNNLAMYYYNLGNAYYQQEKYQESLEAYKQSLRINPDDEDARHNLFYIQEKLRKIQREQEKSEKEQQQNNQPLPKPTEYAKQLKAHAEKLVAQQKYSQAYELMKQGERQDQTVKNFARFTEHIQEVMEINNNY